MMKEHFNFYYLDDSAELLDTFKNYSESLGLSMKTFNSPERLLESISKYENEIDVLLVDYDLQARINGVDVLREALKFDFGNATNVYLFTGHSYSEMISDALVEFDPERVQYQHKTIKGFSDILDLNKSLLKTEHTPMSKSAYVLEHMNEGDRLEFQAKQRNYDPMNDFTPEELDLSDGMTVLDAGCGSGVVCRMIAKMNQGKDIKVIGIDSSQERIDDAKRRASEENLPIQFKRGDVTDLKLPDLSIDMIISRCVYEHNPHSFAKITNEAYRVLKEGGTYFVIDTDGILANLESDDSELMKLNQQFLAGIKDYFEPFPCRKLPRYLTEAGFKFETPKHIPMIFCEKDDLEYERQLWEMRFIATRFHLENILKAEAGQYTEKYLDELCSPRSLSYYSRFVFKAMKTNAY